MPINIYLFGCFSELTFKVSTKALNDANNWFSETSLEIAEAILIGRVKVLSASIIEIFVSEFQSNSSISTAKIRPDEITVPFFVSFYPLDLCGSRILCEFVLCVASPWSTDEHSIGRFDFKEACNSLEWDLSSKLIAFSVHGLSLYMGLGWV